MIRPAHSASPPRTRRPRAETAPRALPHDDHPSSRRSREIVIAATPIWRIVLGVLLANILFTLLLVGAIAALGYWFWHYGPQLDLQRIIDQLRS